MIQTSLLGVQFKVMLQKNEIILITGSTGNVGLEVVKSAIALGLPVVAGIRSNKDREKFTILNVETRIIDFEKSNTFEEALIGITRIFLLRPPSLSKVEKFIFPLLERAKKHKIKQVVFLSLLGAENNPITPHRKIEKEILRLDVPYTFLRPSFFMQNLSTTHLDEIKDEQAINVPAGKGKTSFVDIRDIASVAALSFTENTHLNQAYSLTGGEAFDYYQVAEIFTKVLGKDIVYKDPSIFRFYYRLKSRGFPFAQRAIMAVIYSTAKLGLADRITEDIKRVLKREPITFEQFVTDNKNIWIK